MPDIPRAYDATQEARDGLAETVEMLLDLALDRDEKDCPRVEACAELVKLHTFAATSHMVYPLMAKIMGAVRGISRDGEGMARVRAARLMVRIAELSRVASRPRAVKLKPITHADIESA